MSRSGISSAEIEKFSRDATHWWDEDGPFAPLHRLNPVRIKYIKSQICGHYGISEAGREPLAGLSILDVGCGGGLACENLARLGATVTGLDADPVAIEVAREHAAQSGLSIDYKNGLIEETDALYDVVLALEIIEHVDDPAKFVRQCARVVKPGGIVIFSTLNRTAKSFALGIVAAEYILRWVPRGTHQWKRFLRPSQLARMCTDSGLSPRDITGLAFHPLSGEFALSETDMGVNYFLSGTKRTAESGE